MKALIRTRIAEPHYAGGLVDGARMLQLFGDVATELCIRVDGDEGLFRAYESVEFLAPVRAGDFIEAEGEVVKWGNTSIVIDFVARKVIAPSEGAIVSAADLLTPPQLVCRARGTCVVPKAMRREGRFGRPQPAIITAAIVGAETTRAQTPHLPVTAEELGVEAERCVKAGAAIIHLHVRDDAGRASQDGARFAAAIRAIRSRCDVVVQTSTGGAVCMSVAERAGPLSVTGKDAPEMATLNVGSVNFGDDVFMNKAADTVEMAERIKAHGAIPELEIYDAGHIDIAADLVKRGLIGAPLHVQFVLGIKGALSATEKNLAFLVDRLPELGAGARVSWGVAGVGRFQLPMAELAARWGGNLRVGLEDNIYLAKGVLAEGSAPLVEKAVAVCAAAGRRVATVAEARAMLRA